MTRDRRTAEAKKKVATNLRAAVNDSANDVEEIARLASLEPTRLRALLTGIDLPSAGEVWRLALALNVEPAEILPGCPMAELGEPMLNLMHRLQRVRRGSP